MPEQGGSWESPADGECSQGARTLLMLGACDFAHAAQTGGGALLLAYRTRCQSKRHLGRRKVRSRPHWCDSRSVSARARDTVPQSHFKAQNVLPCSSFSLVWGRSAVHLPSQDRPTPVQVRDATEHALLWDCCLQ